MVAIYARQSIDKKDSIFIDTQIELCKRQLPDGTPCVVYPDKGYSGSNINRPEFQRLLEDVKSGKIDRIITYRLDRISRSVLDFANLVDLFNKHGVSFNSTQEQFDTGTPIGRAMANVTAQPSNSASSRTRAAFSIFKRFPFNAYPRFQGKTGHGIHRAPLFDFQKLNRPAFQPDTASADRWADAPAA